MPKIDGGHRRPLSKDADVIIHDTEDGVDLVVHNRDIREYLLKFDFSQSENLNLKTAAPAKQVDALCLEVTVAGGSASDVGTLTIADRVNKSSFELEYNVHCMARNPNGELVEVRAAQPLAGASKRCGDEMTMELAPGLKLIAEQQGHGTFILSIENQKESPVKVRLGTAKGNLDAAPGVESTGLNEAIATAKPHSRATVVRITDAPGDLSEIIRVAVLGSSNSPAPDAGKAPLAHARAVTFDGSAVEKAEAVARHALIKEFDMAFRQLDMRLKFSVCPCCTDFIAPGAPTVTFKTFRIHKLCYDACDKCFFCGEILVGDIMIARGSAESVGKEKKLHLECVDPYKQGSRPLCVICKKQIMDQTWTLKTQGACHTACAAKK